ncbi:MAG: PhoX family phosphatase [Planctomycetota bacterium]|nr:PhoX family phosphatase [Planctomycetota bacterium]
MSRFAHAGPDERQGGDFRFEPLGLELGEDHRVAKGHSAQVLMRWGDPVLEGAPPFDPARVTAEAQARQFGTSNDFTAFMPLPRGSDRSDHGLLCVNHESASARFMWPGETKRGSKRSERIAAEMAAHGHSVIEVRREAGAWKVVPDSRYARRITATTPIRLAGPVRGHRRVRTAADPKGELVLGSLCNCAGGTTPWGTVLIAEENFENYFRLPAEYQGPERDNLTALTFEETPPFRWYRADERFDVGKEPREPNRFGWVVELDPYDPDATPVKRTALGRFKHEGATVVVNGDGRVVVYSGDDEVFQYLYRFVSSGRHDPEGREANRDLLDSGTLYVARLQASGRVDWLPLVWGTGPLTPANGFADAGDVLIESRRAARLLGATPLDRPEDVEVDPRTGRIYVMLTNNVLRTPAQIDGPNPRAFNAEGQILEIAPPAFSGPRADDSVPGHHGAPTSRWNLFMLGGDPAKGRPANPDNAVFDPRGRLWIATDQGSNQARRGVPDGLWACETRGPERGRARLLYACPRGAEMCGPSFTPDGRTLFVAVQHPGQGRRADGSAASFARPATRWPDFAAQRPARCAVVAITRDDGGVVGG